MKKTDKKPLSPLAVRIKDRLEKIGQNQTWLAKKMGIKPEAVSQLISRGTTKRVHEIAELLKTTPEWLKKAEGQEELPELVTQQTALINRDEHTTFADTRRLISTWDEADLKMMLVYIEDLLKKSKR